MTVFVPQEPVRYVDRQPVKMFDLSSAYEFGDLKVLFEPGAALLNTIPVVRKCNHEMRGYCDDDYIIAIGDPSLIGTMCVIAAKYNQGRFTLLKWERRSARYIKTHIDTSGRAVEP